MESAWDEFGKLMERIVAEAGQRPQIPVKPLPEALKEALERARQPPTAPPQSAPRP